MLPLDAPNVTYLWTQLLVEELVRSGVGLFCLAPGARSTPLTVAVARHAQAEHVVHVDERGAAFMALGYGRATGRPAALVTTSGTAVANAWPAVAEASADAVPLLLVTADRPPELRHTRANQTIDQVKIFGDHVRWQADLPVPTEAIDPAFVLTTADQAVRRARGTPAGPVHLNCMFRKPLEPVEEPFDAALMEPLRTWQAGGAPYTRYADARPEADAEAVRAVAAHVRRAERGLLVAGALRTCAEGEAAARLAAHLGWPLAADVTSQLRLGGAGAATLIAHADQLLAGAAFRERHVLDAVLHLGGPLVSKRLRRHVAQGHPGAHIVVNARPDRLDPDHRVTHRLQSDVVSFCAQMIEATEAGAPGTWAQRWQRADRQAAHVLDAFEEEAEALTEPLVARLVSRHVPVGHGLVLAGSMPVRDADRYAVANRDARGGPALVAANRGASGIDGTVATAAGVARGLGRPVTLVIGDLALLHDLNSLLLLREAPVTVVVLNNDGGGIFHFLPIAEQTDVFELYFGTPHGRSFAHAAALFDLPYHRPKTPKTFVDFYKMEAAGGRASLIEVQTERAVNRTLHEALERRVARRLKQMREGGSAG